ncbi:hypothetical protein KBD08_00630 [Candidatus Babeliales bacterium]|nr:hypothetical protein [Candidatus Babeliales bacterium]
MKKIVLITLVSLCSNISTTPITLPNHSIVAQRLSVINIECFQELTNIASMLAGATMEPSAIATTIDSCITTFQNCLQNKSTIYIATMKTVLMLSKPLLLETLLQDHAAALQELYDAHLYIPLEHI